MMSKSKNKLSLKKGAKSSVVGRKKISKNTDKKSLLAKKGMGHNSQERSIIDKGELSQLKLVEEAMNIAKYNGYIEQQEIIQEAFNLDFKSKKGYNQKLLNTRVTAIDSVYSVNLRNRRFYFMGHIEDIVGKDNNKNIAKKFLNIEKNIDNVHAEHDLKLLFSNSIGIQKDLKQSGCAYSFLSRYGYFITNGSFPIYDSSSREVLINYFGCKIVNNVKNLDHLKNFFWNLKKTCEAHQIYKGRKYEVDYMKFDSFVWLFSRIEKGNLAAVMVEDDYKNLVKALKLDVDSLRLARSELEHELLKVLWEDKGEKELTAAQALKLKKSFKAFHLNADNYMFHQLRLEHARGKLKKILTSSIEDKKVGEYFWNIISFVIDKYNKYMSKKKIEDCLFYCSKTKEMILNLESWNEKNADVIAISSKSIGKTKGSVIKPKKSALKKSKKPIASKNKGGTTNTTKRKKKVS